MFKEMGNAGLALGLIGRANLIPYHVGNDAQAAIREHNDLKAIFKRKARRIGRKERDGQSGWGGGVLCAGFT